MEHDVRIDLAGLAVALAVVVGCESDDGDRFPARGGGTALPTTSIELEVDLAEAQEIALGVVGGGQVVEAKIDDIDDLPRVWEVTVVTTTGERREVSVDAASGSVVGNELDD